MFVSGYRGSLLGVLDAALLKQQELLLEKNIHFVDGINEDLAATAAWGTQMMHTGGKQKFDSVTGNIVVYGDALVMPTSATPPGCALFIDLPLDVYTQANKVAILNVSGQLTTSRFQTGSGCNDRGVIS